MGAYLELATRCVASIESVNQFYCNTYSILLLKSSSEARFRSTTHTPHDNSLNRVESSVLQYLNYIELQHYKSDLAELVTDCDKLRWYGRVNTDGFQKIIRKISTLGNKGAHVASQVTDFLLKMDFTTQAQCLRIIDNLNDTIILVARSQQGTRTPFHHTFCSRITNVNPSIPAVQIFRAIEDNSSSELGELINNICWGDLDFSRVEFLHILFTCTTQCISKSWIEILISSTVSLDAVAVIESCIRKIIVELGQGKNKQLGIPSDYQRHLCLLSYMLEQLFARKLNLLFRQDYLGQTLLHHACEYGLVEVCGIIPKSLKDWEQFTARDSRSLIFLEDMLSRSPLRLSILGSHLEIIKILINFYGYDYHGGGVAPSQGLASLGDLLLLAVRSNLAEASLLLLGTDVDINCCDALGQTPLYLAAQAGNDPLYIFCYAINPSLTNPKQPMIGLH